jgi:ABC-2 type transport system permease protein
MFAVLISVVAAAQSTGIRDEEASGRLDNLLVRPVRRLTWLASRFVVSTALLVLAGGVSGLFAWFGSSNQHLGVPLHTMLAAGLNVIAPALFVLGAGALTFGLRPRLTAMVTYGIVAWSFLIDLLGSLIKGSTWLRDTSLFSHITLAPAANPDWGANALIILIGLAAAGVGVAAFLRRDIESE